MPLRPRCGVDVQKRCHIDHLCLVAGNTPRCIPLGFPLMWRMTGTWYKACLKELSPPGQSGAPKAFTPLTTTQHPESPSGSRSSSGPIATNRPDSFPSDHKCSPRSRTLGHVLETVAPRGLACLGEFVTTYVEPSSGEALGTG